jgi:hypothetical protein
MEEKQLDDGIGDTLVLVGFVTTGQEQYQSTMDVLH